MSYYIDIIDTKNGGTVIELETARKSSIKLEWKGSDHKDELVVVGSSLSFTMLSETAADASFIDMYTGDETRYRVELRKSVDDAIIWQGHIIPEMYQEPYKNVNFFVDFVASDGLGRLKGKYLPDDYYEREKSVIDIFTKILTLTGLGLDLYFAPAIENALNKDWNSIWIDTATFKEKEKKQDCYKILNALLSDTLCVCYQADNRWYIEGLNQRNFREVSYQVYSSQGVFQHTSRLTKLLKTVTPFATPTVSIVSPYKKIEVTHDKIEPAFPDRIALEKNDGWVKVTGVDPEVYAKDWIGHNGYDMVASKVWYDKSRLTMRNTFYSLSRLSPFGDAMPHDETKFVSLQRKIYIHKGVKVRLKAEFEIESVVNDVRPDDLNLWKNPFKYAVEIAGKVIVSNYIADAPLEYQVIFNSTGSAKLNLEFITTESGLMDVKLYAPFGQIVVNKIAGVVLSAFELDIIGFEQEAYADELVNADYSVIKRVELQYGEDKAGFSRGFRLQRLNDKTDYHVVYQLPILYSFVLDGKYYSVVALKWAKLISENKYELYYNNQPIVVQEVVYNFNDGEQMCVQVPQLCTGGFTLKKYAFNDVVGDRSYWERWTDSVYKIENNKYTQTVANILRRMYPQVQEKIDASVLEAVKFNDLILFRYVQLNDYHLINCSWDIDSNKTEVVLSKCIYKDATTQTGNIPPIVNAGDDIIMEDAQTEVQLYGQAYDPDGFIVSLVWAKITGQSGAYIMDTAKLDTNVVGLTGDDYEFKLSVVDNDGATAEDTVKVLRRKNYVLTLEELEHTTSSSSSSADDYANYKIVITPELRPTDVLILKGSLLGGFGVSGDSAQASGSYVIMKNGAVIADSSFLYYDPDLLLQYIAGDDIQVSIGASVSVSDYYDHANAGMVLLIDKYEFKQGIGVLQGLPVQRNVEASV